MVLGVMGHAGRRPKYLQGNRGVFTSKFGDKNFYKGRVGRNEGTHTNKGAYVVRPGRTLRIVAPDLTGFQVRAVRA
jgi:hypothetical protein